MRLIYKILCFLGYHDYVLVQKMTDWSRRIGCARCRRTFGMNDNVRCVIPWDDSLESLYRDFYGVQVKEWK